MLEVQSEPGIVRSSAGDVPSADRLTVPRPRLVTRLDAATRRSRIVVVGSEAGSGKTSLVASWANQVGPGTEVCWRDLRSDHDLVAVLDGVPTVLADRTSDRSLRVVGQPRSSSGRGSSTALARSIIVLDDFPVDPEDEITAGARASGAPSRSPCRPGARVLGTTGAGSATTGRHAGMPRCHLCGAGAESGGDRRPAVSRSRRADPGARPGARRSDVAAGPGAFTWVPPAGPVGIRGRRSP